ncbi:PREDICTED: disease resistance protein RPM1-like [Ipomoea nil]|uniref:disease resistance protein RPM1-like n=1 Tax=Ipomoea nil TaxID=35883 RepID=UPI000901D6CB|nr:PREDICTED: disease resistance protein RPM1-like [Ipomoea nil]
MIESARLIYITTHQKALRCEAYQGLSNALTRGELDPTARGRARCMIPNYQDAMAICKHIGYPYIFITFTSNPKWHETERYVAHRGLKAEDRPDIICRVFKMKLDVMIEDIKTDKLFGKIFGGLAHAHILLFAKIMNRANSANEIDALISAEIPYPDFDVEYHDAVSEFMLHGPCRELQKNSPCTVDVGKLKEQAFQEVIFQWRIKAEVEKTTARLANMKGYVEDSGKGKQDTKVAESWATQLRDTAFELEDLVEEFMLDSKLLELNTPPCNFCQVNSLFANVQSFAKRVKIQFCFHQQLKAMDEKLLVLEADKSKYGIKLKANDGRNELLMGSGSGYMEGIEAVGIDMEVNRIAQLIEKRSGEVKLITIWGAGGCGKTTLAKQVHERVMKDLMATNIDYCWWVDVNHSSDIEYVLRTTINGVYKSVGTKPPAELEKADTNSLQQHILDYLGRKRYVVFFDDVWDHDLLANIKLPGNRASSIIVTSRYEDIANGSFLGASPHYVEVKPLEFDLACTLFCKLAFYSDSWPNGLEEPGRALVGKCTGLPVAILAMARLMSTKGDDPLKWRDALKTLDYYSHEFEAGGSLTSLNRALLLSYYELPTHLKSCFLYCAMFPKTYGIRAKRLIRMCIAEGFINDDPHSGRTLEHIARDYFLQLKNRSLLQIIPNEYNGKELGRIEMHDLYREVAREVIRREMFAEIIKLKESTKLEWKQRRSLIILEVMQKVELDNCYENMKKLRTLIINHCKGIPLNSFPQILQNMKLLRVLVLEWLPDGMEELPNEVGDLIHLRYLRLSGNRDMRHLPNSLGRLHNLQTLDLRHIWVRSLPKCVSELKKLRHLFGSYRLQVPDIVFTFSQLQTLSDILINTIQARELVNIPQLTKLNIIFKEGEECWRAICDSVKKMTNLHSLTIQSDELQEFINFSPPLSLKKLQLFRFGKLLNFISTPNYLRVIYIRMCDVDEDFFNSLEKLPSLLNLYIESYSGDQLLCSEGSFPKLKKLEIVCRKLTKWEIRKGAMTCLESLSMEECNCLEMLPAGLREVEHLKKLHLFRPSQQLVQSISVEGSDRWKIEHILRVTIHRNYGEKPFPLK